MQAATLGKRGIFVIAAKTRKRYCLDAGTPIPIEERQDCFVVRPAVTTPVEVEIYTQSALPSSF